MAVLYIGEALDNVPCPDSLTVSLSDVGAHKRSVSGACVIQVNRAALRTLTIEWKELAADAAAALLNELGKASFTLKYPDPLTGAYRQAEFYCTKREARVRYAVEGAAVLESLRAVCEEV